MFHDWDDIFVSDVNSFVPWKPHMLIRAIVHLDVVIKGLGNCIDDSGLFLLQWYLKIISKI